MDGYFWASLVKALADTVFIGIELAGVPNMEAMLLVARVASIGGAAVGTASVDTKVRPTKKRRNKE